jgi:hypothetical protein
MIYEYALTEDDGLVVQTSNDSGKRFALYNYTNAFDQPFRPANQMSLVRRQLYSETAGMSLRLNDSFTFVDINRHSTSYRDFNRFVAACSASKLSQIRRLILHDAKLLVLHGERPSGTVRSELQRKCRVFSDVNRVCRTFPDVQVVMRLGWEKYMPMMGYIACMDTVYNTRYNEHVFPAASTHYRTFVARHFDGTWPANLRFSVTREFLEQLARDEMAVLYKEDEADTMVGFARLLHENGI